MVVELPPDQQLHNWPYAPDSELPGWLADRLSQARLYASLPIKDIFRASGWQVDFQGIFYVIRKTEGYAARVTGGRGNKGRIPNEEVN